MRHSLSPLLEGMEMNKSEHDWIEQRFENMTAKEELLFRGAMQIEGPKTVQETLQILHSLDRYQLLYVWAEQGQGEPHWMDKWQCVMELEDCHRLDLALDLAQNLHCYEFIPRGVDLAQYGMDLARKEGILDQDSLLNECFDSVAYAQHHMAKYGLSTTDHG